MQPRTAIIHLVGPGLAQVRPAAFVWVTAQGLAWLEPGYLDPDPAPRPAFHEFRGRVRDMDQGLVVDNEDGTALAFDAGAAGDDELLLPAEVRADLEAFAEALAAAGTDWEAERERMAELLDADFEAAGGLV